MRSPRRPRVRVLGARQTEVRPQGCSLIFGTIQAAALQFGNHLIDGAGMPADAATYERLVLVFNGEDLEAVELARNRWTEAKSAGFEVTYWQADEQGRWQRQG